jgi:peroxiredoxin
VKRTEALILIALGVAASVVAHSVFTHVDSVPHACARELEATRSEKAPPSGRTTNSDAPQQNELVDFKFIALDGREVDLARLRGKVVLLDFWAMWCTYCLEELANIKEAYTRYHAQGFEVVGVSLDSAEDLPKVKRFVARRKLPWPQAFGAPADTLARRFAVTGIPRAFLLDKTGLLVSADAKGEVLEGQVRQQLGLMK